MARTGSFSLGCISSGLSTNAGPMQVIVSPSDLQILTYRYHNDKLLIKSHDPPAIGNWLRHSFIVVRVLPRETLIFRDADYPSV